MSIVSQGFFMLRRPRYSLDLLYRFNERVNNRPELFEEELIRFFSQPSMLEAIYVASPELYASFIGLLEGRVRTSVAGLLKTLYKYFVRMTSRSTPYGLFAGCAMGEISDTTNIRFDETAPPETHVRLDMNYVAEVAEAISRQTEVRSRLKFYPNTSLYRIGDTYRYVECSLNNQKRAYVLASVERSAYLDRVLLAARDGCLVGELIDSVTSADIGREEATWYIDALINAQILVSELAATVTGQEFFFTITEKLRGIGEAEKDLFQLEKITELLRSAEPGIGKYKAVESLVTKHFAIAGSKDLIQTDLFFRPRSCTISGRVIETLTKEYKNLAFLGLRNPQPEMELFKKRFADRYGQREMPLLEVLDCETGIGYGDVMAGKADNLPLLEDLRFPGIAKPGLADTSPLAVFREKLFRQAVTDGENRISLTDCMLKDLQKQMNATAEDPDSFYLFGNLIAGSEQDMDRGNFKFAFKAMGGPSGLKLLGRFCHGHEQLAERVKMAVAEEERSVSDVVFAEIAHLPQARAGNVLMRPHLRDFEIPYLAGSSMPRENQITPDDLMVSVSASGEIILWSKRLNKRIIPRLTNAHNFSDGLPVYRFLCELTYQHDYRYLGWDWGHLSSSAFLPRVEYKHWVLSRAMWNIERETVTGRMGKDALSAAEWRILRKAYGIPRFVQLRHGDSELLIDGNSDFAVEVLCNAIRKYGKVTLAEFPEHDENGLLGEPGARYVHEIILPLIKRNDPLPEQPSPRQFRAMGPAAVKRDFIVGSEWLYVKIYTGTRTADRLLASVIKPFADRLVANGTIEKWFFVRFADPDHHIRLRFRQGNNPSFWQTVLTQLHPLMEPLLCNGTVHKVQLDTYKRELERYGRHAFEEVESIFFADSCAVSGLLGMLSGDEGEHYRWLIGLRGTDMLLDDMGFTPEHKKRLVGRLQEQFFREFGGDTNLNVQLNTKYRLHREEIARFLDPRQDASNRIEGAIRLFEGRSARVIASMAVLFPLAETDVGNFAGSLVHMFLNRLFVSQQREHELVVYHYLKKYYESKLARKENVPRKAFCGTDH